MSSGSVSSSGSRWCRPKCNCGDQAVLKPSRTQENPGRRFFSCPKYPDPRACEFFEWFDDDKIVNLERENKYLKDKGNLLEEKANFLEDKAKEYEMKYKECEKKAAKELAKMTRLYEWKINEARRLERKFWLTLLVALMVLVGACVVVGKFSHGLGIRVSQFALPH